MATPYNANNTGGTLPLPRIHIPTWFTINSVSQYNDALLDLDLLDNEDISVDNTILDLGDSSTSNETSIFNIVGQNEYSDASFQVTIFVGNNNQYNTTAQWKCEIREISDEEFEYWIYFIVNGPGGQYVDTIGNHTYGHYTYNKNLINKNPFKVISPQNFIYYIKETYFSSFDYDYYSSEYNLRSAVARALPSSESDIVLSDIWDVITNEDYFDNQTTLIFGNRIQEEITIGNTVPKLGSIIAYSDTTEQAFLPDTNSSHILYFKNAELKSFNFAVQNNTVIDRIEKLYRYAGLETNLTTEFEDEDVDPKNMIINEGTAHVLENIQTLFLTEGSVVTSA